MPVRTTPITGSPVAVGAGATVLVYTVPVGRTLILKSWSSVNTGGSTGRLWLQRNGADFITTTNVLTTDGFLISPAGWIAVLDGGDTLHVRSTGSSFSCSFAGSLLVGEVT